MSVFNSSGAYDTNRAPNKVGAESFSSLITRIMPNGHAPIFSITSTLDEEIATQVLHSFFTKTMVFPSVALTSAATAGATTLTVASTAQLIPGMVVQTPARENMLVLTVPSATSITVQRALGTVTAAAIASGAVVYQIGNANAEGSKQPQATRLDSVRVSNLTQIFRNAWAVTGTVAATAVIAGGSHVSENKMDCASFHARDIETGLIFGQQYEGIRDGEPFHLMDGLIELVTKHAPNNIFTAQSTTNATQLEEMLDIAFDQITDAKSPNERALFVGSKALSVINTICRLNGNYQLMDGQTSWGLQFKTFKTARGAFHLMEHPLFNSNATWSAMAIAVDFPTFNLAYLQGRKTAEKRYNADGAEATNESVDATGGVLTSELTTTVRNPAANVVIYGLTKAGTG